MAKKRPRPKRASAHYSGILPQKGWPQRNYRFFRHRIVPGMFRRRGGSSQPPQLTPPAEGLVRATWIGHAAFFIQFADHSLVINASIASLSNNQSAFDSGAFFF